MIVTRTKPDPICPTCNEDNSYVQSNSVWATGEVCHYRACYNCLTQWNDIFIPAKEHDYAVAKQLLRLCNSKAPIDDAIVERLTAACVPFFKELPELLVDKAALKEIAEGTEIAEYEDVRGYKEIRETLVSYVID